MENDNPDDIVFNFDKFVEGYDNKAVKENQENPEAEKTYARQYIERYRELPQNRTRYSR